MKNKTAQIYTQDISWPCTGIKQKWPVQTSIKKDDLAATQREGTGDQKLHLPKAL